MTKQRTSRINTAPVLLRLSLQSFGEHNVSNILEFSSNVSEAEAPAPLPAGTYPAEIVSAESKVSNASGNRYLAIRFRISPDHYPADFTEGDDDGVILSYNRLLVEDTAQARYRLRRFGDALGITIGTQFDVNSLVGLVANVAVTNSEYEGEPRAEISGIVAG